MLDTFLTYSPILSYSASSVLYRTGKALKRFVVLEGLDASGKSTQSEQLCLRLQSRGMPVLRTSEPTDSPYGEAIRQILASSAPQPHYLALLYAADRALHLYHPQKGIIAFLKKGWVISSRYLFSSFAYQGEVVEWDTIALYNREFPLPQWLIYLDIGAQRSEHRLSERQQQRDMFEHEEFLKRVTKRYSRLLKEYADSGMRILRIDATQRAPAITDQIWNALQIEGHS